MLTTSGKGKTDAEEFIEASRVLLHDQFLPKLTYCLEEMPEEDIWWRPNQQSNSVGNLILHLCGNMKQWIVSSIGSGRFERDRDAEFSARSPVSKAELIANYNNDLGEFWEWVDKGEMPFRPAMRSVQLGVNYFVYAMSH